MTAPATEPDPGKALVDAVAKKDLHAALTAADAVARVMPFLRASMALEKAIDSLPEEPGLVLRYLELLQANGDWIRYDQQLVKAYERHPRRADFRFVAGRGLEARRRDCAAIREYGRAARLDPDDLEAVQRIARLFRVRGRPFLARRRLRPALRRHPDSAALHATMAYSYIDDKQYKKAVRSFEKAVSMEPDDSPYLDDWGGALLLTERWREASQVAMRSLKRHAKREKAWTVYAVAHRHLGDRRRAEHGYRMALESSRKPTRARLESAWRFRRDELAQALGHARWVSGGEEPFRVHQ